MEKVTVKSFSIYPKHLEQITAYIEPRLINFSQFVVQAILEKIERETNKNGQTASGN